MIRTTIGKLIERQDLTRAESADTMNAIMSGKCTDAQISCFLTALRLKGETVDEITGAASVMRAKASRIAVTEPERVIDTCGTGGDGSHTVNVSTAAALVAAAGGAVVAKHGNRSVSSKSGSADVLRELGVNIEAEPASVEACIREAGIGFLFAPLLHGAMKHAIGPRREIGIRTIFNILGPLTNPAGATRQIIGVYDAALTETLARVLHELGSVHALVVHGADGLDEITISGSTTIAELSGGEVAVREISPGDFGISISSLDAIRVTDAAASAAMIARVFAGERGAARDIIQLNAGAALYLAGVADDLAGGIEAAGGVLDSGKAAATLKKLIQVSTTANV